MSAALLRVLLLVDLLVLVLVVAGLVRERRQLVELRRSVLAEGERARAARAAYEVQSEYVQLVLGAAERMVGVPSTDDLASIVTSAACEITGAPSAVLWLVSDDGSLVPAGTEQPSRAPKLFLATPSGSGPPSPGWAVPLTSSGGDLLGVLEVRGRKRPPGGVDAIVEALASHAAGALEVHRRYARLRAASYTDPLTGLRNRWALNLALATACDHATRTGKPLSVVMVDVDHFKRYNDLHGHAEGDRALAAIAHVLDKGLRRVDDGAFRYGGEEFVLILPGADLTAGCSAAERLRLTVLHASDGGMPSFPISASFGVAALSPDLRGPADLLAAADAALYRAKRLGRDRVEGVDSAEDTGAGEESDGAGALPAG